MSQRSNHLGKLIKERMCLLSIKPVTLNVALGWKETDTQPVYNIIKGRRKLSSKHIGKMAEMLKVSKERIVQEMTLDYREELMSEVYKNDSN